jgi:sesquipedalian
LFYYEKKGNPEPLGMIILEGCLVELAEYEEERFCFSISFPGNRTYILAAENQISMENWMKALTTAGFVWRNINLSYLISKFNLIL